MVAGMTAGDGVRVGLRERKKQETRTALSLAAIRLSVERGWDNVTVEDIAAAANVSVRTFHNYFSSKAEAIAARHLDRMLRIADELRARPASESLWDAIATVVQAHLAPMPMPEADGAHAPDQQRINGLRLMLTEPALHGEVLKASAAAQTALAGAIAERTGTDALRDVYPKLAAAVVAAAIAVAIEHSLRADPPIPVDLLLHDVFDQLTAGLPGP
jgi:AcrR family transcriptional regulator